MLFNSVSFLLFFLAVFLIFWNTAGTARLYVLLISSLFFYGFWSVPFLIHFVAVLLVNYIFIHLLLRRRDRAVLIFALALNLCNLAFFKYTNSLLDFFYGSLGFESALELKRDLGLLLPLAISFYTFQIIALLVDIWRGEIREISLLRFMAFILFFPHQIAGPIMRHSDFLAQMDAPVMRRENLHTGIFLIMQGLVKKILIADELAALVNPVWRSPSEFGSEALWLALLGFSIQIYGDFSGYTDMARGLARLLGYNIPENFYYPFLSTSFAELWRRWHVTLSTWLRDYLYIPLGGNRVGPLRYHINILIVMSLGGLWHGDTYTYFLWGFLHALFLILERVLRISGSPKGAPEAVIRWSIVMLGWMAGVVFFRSESLSTALDFFRGLVEMRDGGLERGAFVIQLVFAGFLLQVLQKYLPIIKVYLEKYYTVLVPALSVVLFYMLVRIERPAEQFIYFQF
jgi:D-alanyl-lipoteichoic acid acyltransferase DltB (MBOAT superfamily)